MPHDDLNCFVGWLMFDTTSARPVCSSTDGKWTTQKWFYATLTWINVLSVVVVVRGVFWNALSQFPQHRQGNRHNLFWLRLFLSFHVSDLPKSCYRFENFGNFIFRSIWSRMRRTLPNQCIVKTVSLTKNSLICVNVSVVCETGPIKFRFSRSHAGEITYKTHETCAHLDLSVHAPTKRWSFSRSMRNQPYANFIYKCDLLIELSLKYLNLNWITMLVSYRVFSIFVSPTVDRMSCYLIFAS